MLMDFLKTHTTMELYPCGDGFYAAHRETAPYKPSLALRADYDALALPDGTASHLCGHDGHAAALCGAALLVVLAGILLGEDYLLPLVEEPARSTGEGLCVHYIDVGQADSCLLSCDGEYMLIDGK